jgi:hypothetical protein
VIYVEPGNVQHLELIGPKNTLVTPDGKVDEVRLPFDVYLDPDLVGHTPGYRCASASVLGATGSAIIDLNPWAWSGDHSMARDLVPGTLLSVP